LSEFAFALSWLC